MPAVALADLERRVRAALDELAPEGSVSGVDAEWLRDCLRAAADDVTLAAPPAALYGATAEAAGPAARDAATFVSAPGVAAPLGLRLPLPVGVRRILAVALGSWRAPVREGAVMSAEGEGYEALVDGRYRPTAVYPAVARVPVPRTNGWPSGEALELYPVTADDYDAATGLLATAATASVLYVGALAADALPEGPLQDAAVYRAAARVAGTYLKDYQAMAACDARYAEALAAAAAPANRAAPAPRQARLTFRPYAPFG